jgi:glutamine synthetase
MVKSMGVGDTIFFGPEAEFFVFDDVRYQTTPTTPASSWIPRNCRSIRIPV